MAYVLSRSRFSLLFRVFAFCFSSSSSSLFGGGGGINLTPATISSSSMFTAFLIASPFFFILLSRFTSFPSSYSSSSSIPTTTNLDRSANTSTRSFKFRPTKNDEGITFATTCASRMPFVSFPINWARIFTFGPASPATDKTTDFSSSDPSCFLVAFVLFFSLSSSGFSVSSSFFSPPVVSLPFCCCF